MASENTSVPPVDTASPPAESTQVATQAETPAAPTAAATAADSATLVAFCII